MHACPHTNESLHEYAISGLEALLAGTLALMSAYAHGTCKAHRSLISEKILSNLHCLQAQNALSPEFRKVLLQVGHAWHQHQFMPSLDTPEVIAPSTNSFSLAAHKVLQ